MENFVKFSELFSILAFAAALLFLITTITRDLREDKLKRDWKQDLEYAKREMDRECNRLQREVDSLRWRK